MTTSDEISLNMQSVQQEGLPPVSKWLAFSMELWKIFRDHGILVAQFTDSEFDNHDRKSGLIGTRSGVECYVIKSFADQ